mgnify:CR=1 FL=1
MLSTPNTAQQINFIHCNYQPQIDQLYLRFTQRYPREYIYISQTIEIID